eukprot:522503-Amphidinium_carterae.2
MVLPTESQAQHRPIPQPPSLHQRAEICHALVAGNASPHGAVLGAYGKTVKRGQAKWPHDLKWCSKPCVCKSLNGDVTPRPFKQTTT